LVKTTSSTSSITVQFSRYDFEPRAHLNGAPKELSYINYKPAVNRFLQPLLSRLFPSLGSTTTWLR